jgi:hypothetical protein
VSGAFNYHKKELLIVGLLIFEETMQFAGWLKLVGEKLTLLGDNFGDFCIFRTFEVNDLDFIVVSKEKVLVA